jgi:hypothetical protein
MSAAPTMHTRMTRVAVPVAGLARNDGAGSGAEQRRRNRAHVSGSRQQSRLAGWHQALRSVGAKGRAGLIATERAEIPAAEETLIA